MRTVTVETFDATGVEIVRREITEYLYDATGIRVSSTQETDADGDGSGTSTVTTTTYLSDPQNPTGYAQTLEEVTKDGTGVVTKRVVYTIGHDQISQTVYDAANPTVTTHTFGADGHGSTRVLTDAVAAIAQAAGVQQIYQYDAHGNALGFDPATALTSYLYSGESFDARIGQTYLRARWYDATTGRFNRLDPFFGNVNDPQSLHKYLYVHGDPVNGVDPTGLFSLGGMLVGAAMGANLRSIGANAYGDVHGTINDSIQGLSAGHDLETATWSAWLGNYGFQIGFGISFGTIAGVLGHKQIFERLASAYSRVFRNGDQVVGFVKVGRGIVIPPGPMMPRILKGPYRGRIIPGVTGVVTGSDSTRIQLRKRMIHRMGLTKNRSALRALADYEAHHLLPLELKDHPTLQRIGVALNDPSNGILLPGHVHFGSHARYTAAVSDALDKIHANLKHEEQMEQLWAIQMKIVDALSNRTAKLTGPDPTTYDKWRRILDL